MEKYTRSHGRVLRSTRSLLAFAALIFVIAAIDAITRSAIDAPTRAKLVAWMSGSALMTYRIIGVLRSVEERGTEWSEAERMLFQLAAMIPIAGIIPLAFL